MPAQVGIGTGHDDQMPDAGGDFLLAPGTYIDLAGLKRVDRDDFEVFITATVRRHG